MSYTPRSNEKFPLGVKEDPMGKITERIAALEGALQKISDAKRQLCRNTAEAKSRIQCNISRQLEALRNREVWLLNQLDIVSSTKEDVLQQQSSRLNKTLGVLQSTIQFPDGAGDSHVTRNLSRLDLGDLQPEETPFVSFKSEPTKLRETIMSYGRIDANTVSVPHLQSPFMAPEHPAPSLPKHFEDYNDAEHHVLYKTVEEINRNKTEESCVYVNIPKLSTRLDDWLLYPTTTSAHSADPKFSFPNLSNNLSDWLKSPSPMTTKPASQSEGLTQLDGISTDASIQTWLHKIKQNPLEEEDDFEFIEEMSDTRTQTSDESLEQFPVLHETEDIDMWLYKAGTVKHTDESVVPEFKPVHLSQDKWLLSGAALTPDPKPAFTVDMSRYFTDITTEMDTWLASTARLNRPDSIEDISPEIMRCLRSNAPLTNLDLSRSYGSHMSRSDNPWLLRSGVSTRSSSISPVSSCRSSTSSIKSSHRPHNKWLLNGGCEGDVSMTTHSTCPIMEKFKVESKNICWLHHEKPSASKNANPLANFENASSDLSMWLKPCKNAPTQVTAEESPLKNLLNHHNSTSIEDWVLKPGSQAKPTKPLNMESLFDKGDNKWLLRSLSPFPVIEQDVEEEEF